MWVVYIIAHVGCLHYCTRGLFTFSMRKRSKCSPNDSYYITRWKYEYATLNNSASNRHMTTYGVPFLSYGSGPHYQYAHISEPSPVALPTKNIHSKQYYISLFMYLGIN